MKKIEVRQHLGGGISSGGFGAGERDVFALEAAKVEEEKAAKLKRVRAILDDKEWSPVVKRMAELSGGVTTEEEIEKMMKEDPRVRYILTKKYE
jgi:hypothetical protein